MNLLKLAEFLVLLAFILAIHFSRVGELCYKSNSTINTEWGILIQKQAKKNTPPQPPSTSVIVDFFRSVVPPAIAEGRWWVEKTKNWIPLMAAAKDEPVKSLADLATILNVDTFEASNPKSPSKLGCIVFLLGSSPQFHNELRVALADFSNHYLQYYNYPVFVFHFGVPQSLMDEYRNIAKRWNVEISFVRLDHSVVVPRNQDKASKFSTDLVGPPSPATTWTPEYKYQNIFFSKTMYEHEILKDFKFIWRLDSDLQLFYPTNIDFFEVMSSNNMQFSFHHWGYEPDWAHYVTYMLNEFSEYFIESSPNAFFPLKSEEMPKGPNADVLKFFKDAPKSAKENALARMKTVHKMFSGGGCFSIISSNLMRRWSTQRYIDAIINTGAIWTHRWADQSILPRIAAIFLENPQNSTFVFSNVELLHQGSLYPPHKTVPPWPIARQLYDKAISEKNKQRIAEFDKGLRSKPKVAIFYYLQSKDEIEPMLKSIRNLDQHVLGPMKLRNQNNLDTYIIYNDAQLNLTQLVPSFQTDVAKQFSSNEFKLKITPLSTISANLTKDCTSRNLFSSYFVFKFKNQIFDNQDYSYFMNMSPYTQIVSMMNFNIFEMFAKYDMYLGYHRWWTRGHVFNTVNADKITLRHDLNAVKAAKATNPLLASSAIPAELCYFDYLLLGSFEFFGSAEYISATEKVFNSQPNGNLLNNIPTGCWMVQAMGLRPQLSLAKVHHLSQIYLNFRVDEGAMPFQTLNGWFDDFINTHTPNPPPPNVVYKSHPKLT